MVKKALSQKLSELHKQQIIPDVITFAGNGEPTMHPHFAEIIDDTIEQRNEYCPTAKISVLSNAAHLAKKNIFEALLKVDNNILKLDSGKIETIRLIDRPLMKDYSVPKQVEMMKRFEGNFILQTMFIKGEHQGKKIDNTTDGEITAWLEVIKEIQPKEVMIYTIDRETPEKNLQKVAIEELLAISKRVEAMSIKTNVSG
jgi:wyosine [tRNA(Phe)-imidazoG37] synthetase (radical SAM superfamily)